MLPKTNCKILALLWLPLNWPSVIVTLMAAQTYNFIDN